jgi:tRNA (guanine37-N1)-methyltransferase
MLTFHVITIFPGMFGSYLSESILNRARGAKMIDFKFYNPIYFTKDKHKKVDSKPYGGGPGMVMQAEPILSAVSKAKGRKKSVKTIILSPGGKQFTNAYAERLAQKYSDIILISGRYEGIDARVKKALGSEDISIGSYTLTGGEVPAMVVMDAIARRVHGVLGCDESVEERRVSSAEVYTRPEVVVYKNRKYRVPKILLSGHHRKIDGWRRSK